MASDDIASNLAIDPENRMFWRMPRDRLEAETIRDQILSVAGTLDRTPGGTRYFRTSRPTCSNRARAVPGRESRTTIPQPGGAASTCIRSAASAIPMFEAYDQPNLVNTCDRRNRSTIAPQALLLMNNNFVFVQAKQFAERLEQEAPGNVRKQIERAFRLALGRAPRRGEGERRGLHSRRTGAPRGVCPRVVQLERVCLPVLRQRSAAGHSPKPPAGSRRGSGSA